MKKQTTIQCPNCNSTEYEVTGKIKNSPKGWQIFVAVFFNTIVAPLLSGLAMQLSSETFKEGAGQAISIIVGIFIVPATIIATIVIFHDIKRKTKFEYRCKHCGKVWQIG